MQLARCGTVTRATETVFSLLRVTTIPRPLSVGQHDIGTRLHLIRCTAYSSCLTRTHAACAFVPPNVNRATSSHESVCLRSLSAHAFTCKQHPPFSPCPRQLPVHSRDGACAGWATTAAVAQHCSSWKQASGLRVALSHFHEDRNHRITRSRV